MSPTTASDPDRSVSSAEAPAKVTLVFVHYRTPDLLRKALEALKAAPPAVGHEIVVVDNGPVEDGAEAVSRLHPKCRYHNPGSNLGYARGVNLGVALSPSPFVLVLNPDVEVKEGSVDRLMDAMEADPRIGIAGPKLLYPDGRLQYSCRTFYTMRTLLLRRTFLGRLFPRHPVLREHLMSDWSHDDRREVDWLMGASLLVRREMVEDVGGMDERFFLYFEDVDWCYRAHQRGWKVVYVHDAVMVHDHQRASAGAFLGPGMRRHLESVFRYYEKWSLLLYIFKRKSSQIRAFATLAMDAAMVSAAFLAAYFLRASAERFFSKPVFPFADYLRFLVFGDALSLLVFAGFGLYRPRAWFDRFHGWWQLIRAMAAVSLIMMAATFLAGERTYSRIMVLLYFPLALLLVGLGREALRRLVRQVKEQGLQRKRLLIVGSDEDLGPVRARLAAGDHGYEPLYLQPAALARHPSGQAVDPSDELVRWVQRERIGHVILFESGATRGLAAGALDRLQGMGVPVGMVPESRGLLTPGASVQGILGMTLLPLGALGGTGRVSSAGKRILDLAVSVPGLVLGLPLHLLHLLLSPAPRILRERRIGRRGRPFTMLTYGGSTVLSRGLRCLEHYPKLLNVAAGRMSLVGIHPLSESTWKGLPEDMRRDPVDAPPGLVGPGRSPAVGPEEAAELIGRNRAYVRRWSFEEDLRLLAGRRARSPRGRRA